MAWKEEIQGILKPYMAARSDTGTAWEKRAEAFLENWFRDQVYFEENPEFWGLEPVADDALDRHVVWGMVRGEGPGTVVLIHHYDVVDVEDFGPEGELAHDLDRVREGLARMRAAFDADALADFENPHWLFGRGGADMKAGGAVQMALLKAFSQSRELKGNLILCCLPDEENMSAGMRAAVPLLARLKREHGLEFHLMVDSEPHQREAEDQCVFYEGSVGKLMPLVRVRGRLAHSGRIFEGLNPLHLLSEFVTATELNMDFSESHGGEVLPPPSWLYLKDGKTTYDVSIPLTAGAYMNLLTLERSPGEILSRLEAVARDSFERVIARVQASYDRFCRASDREPSSLPWKANVKSFAALYRETAATGGPEFQAAFTDERRRLTRAVEAGEITYMEAGFGLIDFCLAQGPDQEPMMVLAFSPPFYTSVCNARMPGLPRAVRELTPMVDDFSRTRWNQGVTARNYFTGICDLSYAYPPGNSSDMADVSENMPLWGRGYSIPYPEMEEIRMPVINIGPWGKDLHKLTERVHAVDLHERIPVILDHVIRRILA